MDKLTALEDIPAGSAVEIDAASGKVRLARTPLHFIAELTRQAGFPLVSRADLEAAPGHVSKGTVAKIDSLRDGGVNAAVHALTSREHAVRKALGEFD